MVYLLCFGASALFAQLAYKSKIKPAIIIWSVLSIAVTVILAGLRDYSIGIDVENYRTFRLYWGQAFASGNLGEYLKFYSRFEHEYIFALIIGCIAQYTGSFRLFLFVCHTVIITGVYIGAYRQRKNVNPAMVMLLFYLYFYSHSLNVMRQYMAMAVVFAFLADVLVSMMIHTTAIIAIAPMILYIVIGHKKYLGAPKRKKRTVVILLLCGIVLFVPLIKVIMSLGFLGGFRYFIEGDEKEWPLYLTAFLLVELFGIYVFRKQYRLSSPYSDFFLMCSIAYILLQQLGGLMNYGKRIAAYFSFLNILTIASFAKCSRQRDNRILINTAVISISLFYWVFFYVIKNASQTYPYVLGI